METKMTFHSNSWNYSNLFSNMQKPFFII